MWTQEAIKTKIATDLRWLERAVLAIYDKQTSNEKYAEKTKHSNNVGFNSANTHFLTYCAK